MKKQYCILTTAHAIDDVRVYRRMALSLVKEFDIIWIGPDIHVFENELNNDGIRRILYKNGKGIFGRLLNNFRALRLFSKHMNNIHFVYFPDPDIAFLFTLLFKSKKIIKIFDIHEVYHKYLLNKRVKGTIFLVLNKLIQKAISRTVGTVDLTLAVSETVAGYYASGKNQNLIIRNCLPLNFGHSQDDIIPKKNIFTLVHGKNHPTRGTVFLLDTLRKLKEKGIICKVLMINTENEVFNEYVRKYELASYIDLHDGLPFVEMINQMSQCHVGIIAYGRDLGVDSLPNRIFEYMALGLPVIVPEYSKEMFKIVEREKCGLLTDTEDPGQVAQCIDYLVKNPQLAKEMGERGRKAFLKMHNWETEIIPFVEYLNKN
jgi:glycosyltransferase involved in cell wall biosynthesis